MIKSVEEFKNTESGSVVILGNGPSLDNYKGKIFACPIIGINYSYLFFPNQDYYVTVAYDRLAEIAQGKITANKGIFSCLHKARMVPEKVAQNMVYADMSLPDIYAKPHQKKSIFGHDLSKPIHATFGGIYAIQVALWLGFNRLYLIGFDGGGIEHFSKYPRKKGYVKVEYHIACHWHVADWFNKNWEKFRIFQTNPEASIKYYPYCPAPVLE